MDQNQVLKNKNTEEHTADGDKLYQYLAIAYQTIRESKRILALNPTRKSVLQVKHEVNPASQCQPSLIYELRPRQFHVVVRILDTEHVKWHPTKKELRLRNPKPCVAKHVWHTPQGREPFHIVISTDYYVYLYISGVSVTGHHNNNFKFFPSQSYTNIFNKNHVVINQGIKLYLIHLAVSQKTVIPKNAYLGSLISQNTLKVDLTREQ